MQRLARNGEPVLTEKKGQRTPIAQKQTAQPVLRRKQSPSKSILTISDGLKASVATSKASITIACVTPSLGSGRRTPKSLAVINKENDYAAKIRKKYDKSSEIKKINVRDYVQNDRSRYKERNF